MPKKLWRAAAVLLLAAAFAGQAQAAAVNIAVNSEATVTGPYLTLGELAVITGDDRERVRELQGIKLGGAPTPGRQMTWDAESLGARLQASGANFAGVTWQVPPTITITTAAQTVGAEKLTALAVDAVRRRLETGGDARSFEAAAAGTVQDVLAPLGGLEFKVDFPYGIRFNVPTTALVALKVDGRKFAAIPVKLDVKAYQQVVVASRNIAQGEMLTADNLRLERRETGHMTGYVTGMDQVAGLMARRPLTAGTPVSATAVDKPVVLKRGSAVTIVARLGGIEVTAAGRALQDGRAGDLIRVQNPISKRTMNARVIDGATVQVMLYSGR